jgi:hypothetical protein
MAVDWSGDVDIPAGGVPAGFPQGSRLILANISKLFKDAT